MATYQRSKCGADSALPAPLAVGAFSFCSTCADSAVAQRVMMNATAQSGPDIFCPVCYGRSRGRHDCPMRSWRGGQRVMRRNSLH